MQTNPGQSASNPGEMETATVVFYGASIRRENALDNIRRTSLGSELMEFTKVVTLHQVKGWISVPMRFSPSVNDICDEHFLCRVAKKLGCGFCAKAAVNEPT